MESKSESLESAQPLRLYSSFRSIRLDVTRMEVPRPGVPRQGVPKAGVQRLEGAKTEGSGMEETIVMLEGSQDRGS